GEVDLLLGEAVEGRFGQAEVLRQQCLGGVAHSVGDAERAELGEVAVVEDQHEVARLVAQALKHVAVAAGSTSRRPPRSRWSRRRRRGRGPWSAPGPD